MSTNDADTQPRRVAAGPLVALSIGVVLILVSFLWPSISNGRGQWTTQQALEHQRASAELHQLSHKYDHELAEGNGDAVLDELQAARTEYERLDADLEAARNHPVHFAMVLRILGVLVAVAGGFIYYKDTRH